MLFASNGCGRLPQVLVEYLGRLAMESCEEEQEFILSVRHTGTGDVQSILTRSESTSSWRTVFGFAPADAVIRVRRTGKDVWMALEGEAQNLSATYHNTRKGAAVCTA